jgi:MFS family permease
VVVFAITLAVIQYIDRVCISKAMPYIQRDLHFSDMEAGYVFGAFTLAYALFEIPGGWLGDKFGPKKVLLRVVMWWSFFTAATARAGTVLSMIAVRFLFGAGEAGCFPNIAKAFSAWLPPDERVRAQGVLWLFNLYPFMHLRLRRHRLGALVSRRQSRRQARVARAG